MIIPAAAFLLALGFALVKGRTALRITVALVIFLAPVRGGLLAIADEINLGNAGLAVNALVPALVAAIAVGVLIKLRPGREDLSKPLVIIWAIITAVTVINFPFQEVGLKLFGIGLAQYLVYPTLAVVAWPLMEQGDLRRVVRVIIGAGTVVAASVLIQTAGIEDFIQAASSEVDGFAAGRFAGVTGSYLHTSSFLGVCTVLALGEFIAAKSRVNEVIVGVVITALLSGVVLTFSRSGVIISAIGLVTLFIFAAKARRIPLAVMVVPAVAVALAAGTLGGVSPGEAGDRVASGLNPTKDAGNQQRSDSISEGTDSFRDSTILDKVFGEGLASTGNARQLVGGDVMAVESYYLKLLIETGIIGLLAIGSCLIWAGYRFVRLILENVGPTASAVGAAGVGLSLYNVIYPALETQILALAWWLLLTLCLAVGREYRDHTAVPDA